MARKGKCSWGHPALTEAQVRTVAENMIPQELRPFYIGCDIMKQVLDEPYTEWNCDIQLNFKAPVASMIVWESRYAHGNLYSIQRDFEAGEIYIDADSAGDEDHREWDEETAGRPVVAITAPAQPIKWHKRGWHGED